MGWVKIEDREPIQAGTYRVKVQMCDIPDIVEEKEDYFDGEYWHEYGYKQFINEWFEEINANL